MKELKPKKCKSCGEPFKPFSSLAKVCSMACSLDYIGTEKQKAESKANAKRRRDFLANDSSHQKKRAQKAFNEFIRLRDSGLPCVSCDKPADWHGQWHASHFHSVGARPDLRFNEDNCHKSCSQCNLWLSGNLTKYKISLILRIGEERVSALDIDHNSGGKMTAKNYSDIAKKYQEKIKNLKLSNKQWS